MEFLFSFLQSLAVNLRHGVLAVNKEGRVQVINYFCGNILKVKVQDAMNRHISEIVAQSRLPRALQSGEKCFDQQVIINGVELRLNTVPINKDGRITGAVEIWEDRTEVNSLSQKLREAMSNNILLDNIINAAFEDLGAVDAEGRISYVSENTARSLGFDRRRVIGVPARDIRRDCLMEKVARSGVPKMGMFQRSENVQTPVMVLPIIQEGRTVGAVCKSIFRDMDETRNFVKKFSLHNPEKKQPTAIASGKYSICKYTFDDIIGNSLKLSVAKDLALRAARSGSTLLILGESGTGKEIFAHSIHDASNRSSKPFVRVNCAGIPETLLESELFGFEDGSFTGARKGGKPGKFEQASGGTIFLDEIGDMSLAMQAKLLRVLQEGEIEKIGSTRSITVDVRVIAATHNNLADKVSRGEFREDLFYRLEVISITLPPLRVRLDDLPVLINKLVSQLARQSNKSIEQVDDEVINLFTGYNWPGNVRELKNVLEGAISLSRSPIITVKDLPPHYIARLSSSNLAPPIKHDQAEVQHIKTSVKNNGESLQQALVDTEKNAIMSALKTTAGNKRRAARMLGISRSTFYNKLKRYELG